MLFNNAIISKGFDGMSGLALVERLNLKTMKQWQMIQPLSCRRSSVGVVTLNNYLYASIMIDSFFFHEQK